MLYALVDSDHQSDRVRLFPSVMAAQAADPSRPARPVSVRFCAEARLIVPLWTDPCAFDPDWRTPAYDLGDETIMARAPIPAPLFGGTLPAWIDRRRDMPGPRPS
jgi:hypothetical protein